MVTDDTVGERDRLLRLLGSADLAWLMRVVAARVGDGSELIGPVSLLTATPAQRTAAAELFGRRSALRGATVRLEELDALLRTSGAWPAGLGSAATALAEGVLVLPETPVVTVAPPRPPAADQTWTSLEQLPSSPVDWLAWWRGERTRGTPAQVIAQTGSADAAAELAAQLADVLALLPATGELRTDLAEAVTGSPDDLNDGLLPALVLSALRWHARLPPDSGVEAVWASAGVVCDELADTVLTLRLPAAGSGPTGVALAAWAAVDQPVVLTFRQLRLDPPVWRPAPAGGVVQVCGRTGDVSALMAARTAVGAQGGQPVRALCVGEPPSVSAQLVLAGLRGAGWALREDVLVSR